MVYIFSIYLVFLKRGYIYIYEASSYLIHKKKRSFTGMKKGGVVRLLNMKPNKDGHPQSAEFVAYSPLHQNFNVPCQLEPYLFPKPVQIATKY